MGGFNPAWFLAAAIGVEVAVITASSLSAGWRLLLQGVACGLFLVGAGGLVLNFHRAYELRWPFAARQAGPIADQVQFPLWPQPYRPVSVIGRAFKE